MAKVIKICKTCGKPYEYCHTQMRKDFNPFRWQDVACSPECGEKYFAAVLAARAADLDSQDNNDIVETKNVGSDAKANNVSEERTSRGRKRLKEKPDNE